MTASMGAWLKLGTILVVLALSYTFTSMIIGSASVLSARLNLVPTSSTSYLILAGDLLFLAAAVTVLAFFTIPGTLAAFGHGGIWLKHVLARFGKDLLVFFGASFVLYVGAEAASTLQTVPLLASATSALPVLAMVGLVALAILSRDAFLKLAATVLESFFHAAMGLSGAARKQSTAVVELQLTATKPIRGRSDERVLQEEALRFQRFGRALASLGAMAEFKMSFRGRRGRVFLLAKGRGGQQALERRLLAVVKTYLPEARPAPVNITNENLKSVSVLLAGAPEQSPNPLEPVARFFIENGFEGDYAVVLRSHRANPVTKLLARREQRKLAEDSAHQKTVESIAGDQDSATTQDHLTGTELEAATKKVERQASPQSVDAWIFVSGVGNDETEAKKLAESAVAVVRASLSSHREKEELKFRTLKQPFQDLQPRGTPSVILATEAASLIWVPQMAIGTAVAPAVEFEMPPAMEGEIELGRVVLQSGESGHVARIPLDSLPKHIFVTGMTGSGKTTTCLNLLLQLHRLGVPFLVIEPVKSEYRSLVASIPGLQIFTVGDEDTAPFRLNMFEPPSGVKVQTHIENLEAAWNASFVMYAPLPYVIKRVLLDTYKACGWDVTKDQRGRPVTLDDFEMTALAVSNKLGYEPKVTMDIAAALRARITNLSIGSKRQVFNTTTSIPLETILRRPTVIELKSIANNEEKAFVALLILSNLAEHLEARGQSKQLRHFTLIEEAHRMLPNISTAKGDPEATDPRKSMVEQFANMLAEVRAYGEGLAIVEQIPTKILPDAIKNTATKVAHRVPAKDDREVLAGAMDLTEEQMGAFGALQPGEAIIHVAKHPLPIKIAVPNVTQKFGLPVGEIGDDEVKRLMTDFYLRNPLPRTPQSVLNEKLLRMVEAGWFKTRFQEAYDEWLETGSTKTLATLLIQSAAKLSDGQEDTLLSASRLLKLACERYLRFDLEKNEFPAKFMRAIEKSMRNAK